MKFGVFTFKSNLNPLRMRLVYFYCYKKDIFCLVLNNKQMRNKLRLQYVTQTG